MQKYCYGVVPDPRPPQGRLMEIPRGWGVSKAQFFEQKYDTKMEFPEGWGVQFKKPSTGGVWIFSGTTHIIQISFMQRVFDSW